LALIEQIWKSENSDFVQEGASKSSFGGHPFLAFFMIFTCVLSGEVFAVPFLSLLQNCDDFGLHSGPSLGPFWHHFDYHFSNDLFIKLFKSKRNPVEATQGTSQVRGEPRDPGDGQETPRGTKESEAENDRFCSNLQQA